jgi:hypothetical protein
MRGMNGDYWSIATTSATTCSPIDSKEIMRLMDEVERKWPKRNRCVALEMPPTTEDALAAKCNASVFPVKSDGPLFTTLYGLPIKTRLDIPSYSFVERMADGSEVIHYRSGYSVRCLAGGRKEGT